MAEDVKDWKDRLTKEEQGFSQTFLDFFKVTLTLPVDTLIIISYFPLEVRMMLAGSAALRHYTLSHAHDRNSWHKVYLQ